MISDRMVFDKTMIDSHKAERTYNGIDREDTKKCNISSE